MLTIDVSDRKSFVINASIEMLFVSYIHHASESENKYPNTTEIEMGINRSATVNHDYL